MFGETTLLGNNFFACTRPENQFYKEHGAAGLGVGFCSVNGMLGETNISFIIYLVPSIRVLKKNPLEFNSLLLCSNLKCYFQHVL